MAQSLWRRVWRFFNKLGIKLPYEPAIPLLGICQNQNSGTCTPKFSAVLFTVTRTWKQPRCLSKDEGIKKLWYIHTMEYYSVIKRN